MIARLPALIFAAIIASNAWAQEMASLPTDATQLYFFARGPNNSQAVAVLFPVPAAFDVIVLGF